MHDNIPKGADHYWGADLDIPDTRDDQPDDDHEISDERAEQWAREMGEDSDVEGAIAALVEVYDE